MKVQTLRPAWTVALSLGLLGGLLTGTAQADPPGPLTVPPPPSPVDEYTIPPLPTFGPIERGRRHISNGNDLSIGRFRIQYHSPGRPDTIDSSDNDFLVPPVYSVAGKAKLTDQKSCFPAECCATSAGGVKSVSGDAPCGPAKAWPMQPAPCHPAMAGFEGCPIPVAVSRASVKQCTSGDNERKHLIETLMTLVAENAQLKAQAEFTDRQERMFQTILEAREENAKLKGQIEALGAQQAMMSTLLESREEVAKLKTQIELLGQQQEFLTGMVQVQLEAERAKLENAQLKARLSELERPQRPTVTVLPAPEAATVKPNKGQRLRIQAIVPTDYVPVPTPDDDCDEAEEAQPN